jgi:hypothetical protein
MQEAQLFDDDTARWVIVFNVSRQMFVRVILMSSLPPAVARVTRQFNASAERVFDAWLSPDLIGRWMFGPNVRDEEVVRILVDARVGGAFSFIVRRGGRK